MVLVTSLSVLTTEGWMMVALQGTAATGGLNEDFREVFRVSARIDSISLKSHKCKQCIISLYRQLSVVKYFHIFFSNINCCFYLCVMAVPSRGALL